MSPSLIEAVRRRANDVCEYCRYAQDDCIATFNCDHCIPISQGGVTSIVNLAWACPRCNGHKLWFTHGVDPESEVAVRLFNPRSDEWFEHFRWSEDGSRIIGRTPVGRATVIRLSMNSPRAIQIRSRLLKNGQHPMQRESEDQ